MFTSRQASYIIAILLIGIFALMGGAEAMQAKQTFDNRIAKINNPFTLHIDGKTVR